MPKIHCLTVGKGDCTLIEHGSGRLTMIDICGGNLQPSNYYSSALNEEHSIKGNFRMCNRPTNPLDYLDENQMSEVWRFISTHPDMDHLDGFNNLMTDFSVHNFWDHGARKVKPEFSGAPYSEADWDRYAKVRDGKEEGTTVIKALQGKRFKYANEDEENGNGDCLTICSPNDELIRQCNQRQQFNDASYIIVYRAKGGKVVLAGDADDLAWECAIRAYPNRLANVGFLLAPHHGRDSGRNRNFLNHLNPRISLLGCAPSKYLAYDAWRNRRLKYYTQNQCGNVVIECKENGLEMYIENEAFALAAGQDLRWKNTQGYYYLGTF